MVLRDFASDNYTLNKEEIELRATKIDLLEKNLIILKDEYYFNPKLERKALLSYDNTFGDHDLENDGRFADLHPSRDSPIFVKFDKNDVQINKVSANISKGVPVLKDKMENIHLGALQQSETLAKLSKRDYTNYQKIREKKNSLMEALIKIRNPEKFWVDAFLIIFIICMISVIVSILV